MYTLKTKDGTIVKSSLDYDKIKKFATTYLKENKQTVVLYNEKEEMISEFKLLNG